MAAPDKLLTIKTNSTSATRHPNNHGRLSDAGTLETWRILSARSGLSGAVRKAPRRPFWRPGLHGR
jgi:hypothetical protein